MKLLVTIIASSLGEFLILDPKSQLNLACDEGWEKHPIEGTDYCFKNIGNHPGNAAQAECEAIGGEVPLPVNIAQNDDLADAWNAMGVLGGAWIDLNDEGKRFLNREIAL